MLEMDEQRIVGLEKEIGNEPSRTGHSGIFDMRVIAARASSCCLGNGRSAGDQICANDELQQHAHSAMLSLSEYTQRSG